MHTRNLTIILTLGLAVSMVGFTGCSKKQTQPAPKTTVQKPPAQTAPAPAPRQQTRAQEQRQAVPTDLTFRTVYFDYDQSDIRTDQRSNIQSNAELMQRNGTVKILVEGHCDERGTDEYNIALGQRRADAAKQFLVEFGIDGSRINTVSYGESRPVDAGHSESAWAKNRRAEFVTISTR
jgi:peptidoglycan-associated lipoprotein